MPGGGAHLLDRCEYLLKLTWPLQMSPASFPILGCLSMTVIIFTAFGPCNKRVAILLLYSEIQCIFGVCEAILSKNGCLNFEKSKVPSPGIIAALSRPGTAFLRDSPYTSTKPMNPPGVSGAFGGHGMGLRAFSAVLQLPHHPFWTQR